MLGNDYSSVTFPTIGITQRFFEHHPGYLGVVLVQLFADCVEYEFRPVIEVRGADDLPVACLLG
jgi:hypothetical protein